MKKTYVKEIVSEAERIFIITISCEFVKTNS